jgi:YD repeat-containing protein
MIKRQFCITFGLATFALLSFSTSSSAMVAIGNGNYFIGFTDLEHEAPLNSFQLKIQRTNNSRSQFDGLFGYGWGSDYEAFLLPSADGSVVIQESGGGDKTRFSPKEFSKAELEKQVDRLVEAYGKKNRASGTVLKQKREKWIGDANERDEEARSLGIFPELPVGTKLYSTQRGDKQTVTVIKGGYVREYGDGKQELFNVKTDVADQGVDPLKRRVLKGVLKVSKLVDPVRKAQVFYDYDNKGRLTSVTDKKSQTIRITYGENGKISNVADVQGNKATYEYCDTSGAYNAAKKCGKGDLVRSKDTSGAIYTYRYDELHNLIRVGYPRDGKPEQEFEDIAYWPLGGEGQGGVKSVKNQNGSLSEYKYWQDPRDKEGHYKTDVKTTYSSGKSSSSSYEYNEKKRADGSRYRYRLVAITDGDKTETIYNECCGQPLQVINASGTTKFEYYAGTGLPREKDTPSENVQWVYHAKFHGKITKVTVNDKAAKSAKSSEFQYDDKNGQLVKARTSDGKGIVLQYDGQGRIAQMIDQDKRKIVFKYSSNSKPAEITQEGVGSIQVSYDKGGNIKDVKSKGGRQIAISVAAAFQNLLEIIKPAGIQPI